MNPKNRDHTIIVNCDALSVPGKVGEEDRTPDIQLGNMNAHPRNTAENVVFSSTPSSIPSTSGSQTPDDLSRIIENWARLSPAAQTVLLAAIEAAAIKP